jgi:thiosulfate reductase cytochrome b subunit
VAHLEAKHPRLIRWCHWINVPLLAMMVYSGILIYWAYPVYRVGLGEHTLVAMRLSRDGWTALHLNNRLAHGMALHFFFMWLIVANGAVFVVAVIASGEWRHLIPGRSSLREAVQVLLHDLHLSRAQPPPRKFNGAQQIAYTAVVLMGIGSLISGLAIYKPVQLEWLTTLLGGYQGARFVHFWLAVSFVGFLVIHVAQVFRAGWNNLRAMLTGYEVVEDPVVETEP